jgi:hypothetical protein
MRARYVRGRQSLDVEKKYLKAEVVRKSNLATSDFFLTNMKDFLVSRRW